MCGIVGWRAGTSGRVDCAVLGRMRDTMIHRGPDGAGLWLSSDGRMGLGFRRLAIVDLSADANQPMSNEDGTIEVVFNGEIYNHQALRRELAALGHRFKTDHSDTETIVHGYEQWGAAVVEHLHGMFAIGVWDGPRQRLLLARDRVGIKPLYFAWSGAGFLFASEIKALLAHPELSAEMEPRALYHYLSFLTTPAPLTMFRGIYKLPAGYRLIVERDGQPRAERYWDALPGRGPDVAELRGLAGAAREEFAARRVRELLEAAVDKRMMSDVPLGVFLSGGLDSSTNVALMCRHSEAPVRTYTVGFSDHPELNELEYARAVAGHFKTDHREVMVDERAMREYLPSLIFSQDEPIADWVCIPLYFVSKLARDSGTIVIQVGEGSDEQFCGYASYMGYLRVLNRYGPAFARLPSPMRRMAGRMADWLGALDDTHDRYLDLISRAGADREIFWSGTTIFPESRKARLLAGAMLPALKVSAAMSQSGLLPDAFGQADSFAIVRELFARFDREAPGRDVLTRMIYSEFKLRLPELLLMRVDKIGMSASIEPRVPFLDHELVEFTMNLPMSVKVAGNVTKRILKRAVRGLVPDNIIDRPKMGFSAPMGQWLRGEFGRAVEAEISASRFFDEFPARRDLLLGMLRRHRRGGADFSLYLWTFYNAVAWFDQWIDGGRAVRAA